MKTPDLNKARDRDFPKRCQTCFLIESLCVCVKRYRSELPKSGVSIRDPRRIHMAVFN